MASIRKRGPYQWEVRIRKKGYPVQSNTFETKMDAEAWASTIESEMVRGIFRSTAEAERTTLEELLVRYEKEVSPLKKGYIQELSKIQVIKRADISKYSVAKIGGKELAEFRDARLEKVSPKTVRDDLVLLGHVFKVAMQDWGMVFPHGNPIDAVRKPKIGNNKRDRRLTGDEQNLLFEACASYGGELLPIVILAIETGMRRGEIAGLRWEFVKGRVISIPETKNGESRNVPLSTVALHTLSRLPRRIDGKIFGMRADSITKAFSRACKKAEITDLRFHDLRHEATSRFFELGLNSMQVSAITGHKTLQMLQRYTHLKAEDLAQMLK
jgi:integrase